MATVEKDSVSGQNTTGHEWDGIKELNTPLPKWWVYVFWATVVWAVGYWFMYPAWPLLNGYTQGSLGYSSRGELANELDAQKKARSGWLSKIDAAEPGAIEKDKDLLRYAMAGGKIAFNENCAPCHGTGGVGVPGAYPTLADDEWLWGGTLADIEQTIKYGVRSTHKDTRASEMPKFGESLKPEQIAAVAEYVVSLASKAPAKGSAGEAVFAENCAACHAEDGSGQIAMGAPALNNQIWLFVKGNKESVAAQVASPKHGAMPAWADRLDASTVKMLAVYVHNLGGGK